MLYHPTPYNYVPDMKEISFDVNDVKLQGWVLNEGNEKALIYYGGNAESIELNKNFFRTILSNYTVYLVNYRGYGNSQGTPSEKTLKADALAIYNKINKKHKNISIIGRSLGSGIATYITSKRDINKLVLVTPYDSVESVAKEIYGFAPVSLLLKDKFDSTKYVNDIKVPTLILYTQNDEVIAPKHTEKLISLFKKEQLIIKEIDHAQHNNIETFEEYVLSVEEFLVL